MKVLVTGAAGLLGSDICRAFERMHDVYAVGRTQPAWVPSTHWRECDLRDARSTYETVTRLNPDLIINCAAYNNVDGAEAEPDEAFRGNALVARHLALASQRFDTEFMHISTDYVFDGENAPKDGYREFDACHPLSRYGESKWWAEQFVQQLSSKFYVVRTSWLFGPGRATWIDGVIKAARASEPVKAVRDMVSAPTFTPDLARALLALAESKLFGLYHLSNSGFCTRVEFANEALRLQGVRDYSKLQTFAQAELKLPARRPAFSGLQNLTYKLSGFPALRPWQEALAAHFSSSKVVL